MSRFECQLKSHGQLQLEFHARYPLEEQHKLSEYMLDMYIYTPSQLDMGKENYGVDGFLDDLQTYTRYTHPFIPLPKLIDEKCDLSPLSRIKQQLKNITLTSDVHISKIMYELRMLTNSFRGEVREVRLVIERAIEDKLPAREIIEHTQTFIKNVKDVQAEIKSLHSLFLDARIPEILREGLSNADEAISVKTEKVFLRLTNTFAGKPEFQQLRKDIIPLIAQQSEYRRNAGYGACVSPEDPKANEQFLYREGMLKRWAQSAMYMETNPSKKAKRITHIIASVAAGLAMAFAVGAAFFASKNFEQNSLPWALILVIAYIIKDRIKEVVRAILISKLPSLVSDLSVNLVDPAVGKPVGFTSSWVRFCKPSSVNEIVNQYRNFESQPFRALLPPEDVIHYHKRIKLESYKLFQQHSRINSITEILRLKLNDWLKEMDDPAETLCCAKDDEITPVTANRVYHVNIILKLSGLNTTQTAYKRYRVILTRKGIVRIENVEL